MIGGEHHQGIPGQVSLLQGLQDLSDEIVHEVIATIPYPDEQLFNLQEDPSELDNQVEALPELRDQLCSEVEQFLGACWEYARLRPAEPSEVDETVLKQLQALGYLDPSAVKNSGLQSFDCR